MEQTMNETVAVSFHGCELLARKTGTGYLVALKPICRNIGIEYSGQVQRLKRQPWATVGMIPTVGADGRDRDMFAIDRKTLTMWLATIDTNRVKDPSARDLIVVYQKECAEVLDEYFAYGAVVRAAPGDSDDLLIARALLAAKRKIEERDRQLAEQRPKVEFADSITASPDSVPIAALAHDLEQYGIRMGRNRLFSWLRDNGYLYKTGMLRNEPKQKYVENGWFQVQTGSYADKEGIAHATRTTRLTGKGRAALTRLLIAANS